MALTRVHRLPIDRLDHHVRRPRDGPSRQMKPRKFGRQNVVVVESYVARSYRELRSAGFARRRRSTHRVPEFNKNGHRLRHVLRLRADTRMGVGSDRSARSHHQARICGTAGDALRRIMRAARAQSVQPVFQEDGDTARPQGRHRGRGASDLSDRRALWLEHSTVSKFLN